MAVTTCFYVIFIAQKNNFFFKICNHNFYALCTMACIYNIISKHIDHQNTHCWDFHQYDLFNSCLVSDFLTALHSLDNDEISRKFDVDSHCSVILLRKTILSGLLILILFPL